MNLFSEIQHARAVLADLKERGVSPIFEPLIIAYEEPPAPRLSRRITEGCQCATCVATLR